MATQDVSLYATGARKVPAGAPVGFVPTKGAGYLAAAETGDIMAYRRYWEIAGLVGLRDGPWLTARREAGKFPPPVRPELCRTLPR